MIARNESASLSRRDRCALADVVAEPPHELGACPERGCAGCTPGGFVPNFIMKQLCVDPDLRRTMWILYGGRDGEPGNVEEFDLLTKAVAEAGGLSELRARLAVEAGQA